VDKKEPRVPDFDESEDEVSDALKQKRSQQQVEQRAGTLPPQYSSWRAQGRG